MPLDLKMSIQHVVSSNLRSDRVSLCATAAAAPGSSRRWQLAMPPRCVNPGISLQAQQQQRRLGLVAAAAARGAAARGTPAATSSSSGSRSSGSGDASVASSPLEVGERLKEWVLSQGGVVHPSLILVDDAPCGTRGLVAAAPIDDGGPREPLIAVPERLFMTSDDAPGFLRPLVGNDGVRKLQSLDAVLRLAVLLAHERSLGPSSRWEAYIAALPREPPCAWALGEEELEAALWALGPVVQPNWREGIASAQKAVGAQAEAISRAFGGAIQGVRNVTDVKWAMGNVLSRCFGGGESLALLPLIDSSNHHGSAPPPDGLADSEGETYGVVAPLWEGAYRPLAQGDELYISYVTSGGSSPLNAFLSYGFVPPELLRPR